MVPPRVNWGTLVVGVAQFLEDEDSEGLFGGS